MYIILVIFFTNINTKQCVVYFFPVIGWGGGCQKWLTRVWRHRAAICSAAPARIRATRDTSLWHRPDCRGRWSTRSPTAILTNPPGTFSSPWTPFCHPSPVKRQHNCHKHGSHVTGNTPERRGKWTVDPRPETGNTANQPAPRPLDFLVSRTFFFLVNFDAL